MTDQEIRLKFGEMNAGEMRLARALVAWHEREIAKHKDELASLRKPILADDGRSLGQVAFDAGNAVQKIKFPKQEIEPWEENAEVHDMLEAAAQPWTPAVGDVVRLKSGGPAMTVTDIDPLSLMCAWMNASNELQVEPITTLCLEPSQP